MLECLEGRYKSPSYNLSADPYRWSNSIQHKVAWIVNIASAKAFLEKLMSWRSYSVSPTWHSKSAAIALFYLLGNVNLQNYTQGQ
jgi:hypothetical protein